MKRTVTQILMRRHLIRAFKIYGLEGTEDVIRRVYKDTPTVLRAYLIEYNNLIWNGIRKEN